MKILLDIVFYFCDTSSMEKTYKSIKVGAGEYRELRAYASKNGFVIQHVVSMAIREFLAKQVGCKWPDNIAEANGAKQ